MNGEKMEWFLTFSHLVDGKKTMWYGYPQNFFSSPLKRKLERMSENSKNDNSNCLSVCFSAKCLDQWPTVLRCKSLLSYEQDHELQQRQSLHKLQTQQFNNWTEGEETKPGLHWRRGWVGGCGWADRVGSDNFCLVYQEVMGRGGRIRIGWGGRREQESVWLLGQGGGCSEWEEKETEGRGEILTHIF